MENEYCVYMHVAPNGKRYVGQTCCEPNRRWQNGYGYVNQVFYNAIKKYGWDNFEHIILAEKLTAGDADRVEQYYIELYQTTDKTKGYNLLEGGHGGKHLPEEVKAKIGRANSGENNGRYGHRYSDEEREQMSLNSPWRGRHHTEESKEKIRKALAGNRNTKCGKEHHNAKAIKQYDMDGCLIRIYDTAKEASDETGVQRSGICCSAKGKIKSCGGYIWLYVKDELTLDELNKRKRHDFNLNSVCKKKVKQYDLDGNYIATFNSVSDAQISVGRKNGSMISAVCKNKRIQAYGYIWKYAE